MTTAELDKYLFSLSKNEEEFKNGFSRNYNLIGKKSKKHGESVLLVPLQDLLKNRNGPLLAAAKHDRFQSFPVHCHDTIELNYMYSGNCRQMINGKTYSLTEGQMILLNFDTVHTIEPLGERDILINLNIGTDYLTNNFFNRFSSGNIVLNFFMKALKKRVSHDDFLIFRSEKSERLPLFIKEFMCEYLEPSLVSSDVLDSLLNLILLELVSVYRRDEADFPQKSQNETIVRALHFIEENFRDATLEGTAAIFCMNANYFSNLLKKETGKSFRALVTYQRILTAKKLLANTKMSVEEIADKVGYQNLSFFYAKFKEEEGCTLGEYRERCSKMSKKVG